MRKRCQRNCYTTSSNEFFNRINRRFSPFIRNSRDAPCWQQHHSQCVAQELLVRKRELRRFFLPELNIVNNRPLHCFLRLGGELFTGGDGDEMDFIAECQSFVSYCKRPAQCMAHVYSKVSLSSFFHIFRTSLYNRMFKDMWCNN